MPAKIGSYKGYEYFIIPSLFGALNGYAELPKSWKDGDEDELTVHVRANTETALELADELGKLAAKQGLSFDELGYLHKK